MKKQIIKGMILINFIFTFGFIQQKIYSQEPSEPEIPAYDSIVWIYIKTPKGDSMEARIFYGEPQEWIAYYNAYGAWLIDQYNWTSPTQLASGTIKYNCHAYAWYVSEGGDNVWLNYYTSAEGPSEEGGNPNLENLFNDNSYTFTNDPNQYSQIGRKVLWEFNDHSAITTSDTAYVRSKWGKMPLYQHKKYECPYDTLNPDYFYYKLNPSMTGSTNVLCNNVQRTFSTDITHMDEATLSWTPGPNITYISGAGTSQYIVRGSGDGDSYVNFQITTPTGFTWSTSKSFYAGKPVFNSISGPSPPYIYKGCTGEPYTFWANPARDPDSQSSYTWVVEPGYLDWYFQYQYYDWATIVFNDPSNYYQVIARASNTCGPTNWVYKSVEMMDCYYFSIFPNPASDYVTITLAVPDTDKDIEMPSDFRIQIIDNAGITYYSATKSGESFTVTVNNLKDGNYIVIITYGKKIENLPLIIKH